MSRLTTSPGRSPITSGAAWAARDVADPADWSTHLSTVQQQDIIGAAKALAGTGDQTHDALRAGRGSVLVRGFPTEELTPRETEVAYVGLGLQMGTPVSQNAAGDLLGHVRDEGVARRDPSVRLYQTRQRQDFHTDGADIVGLLCLHPARTGGESRIASSATVYNRMLAERPDLIEVLYQPMFWDRNGEESVGEDPYFAIPVISEVAGSPRVFFIGWYIRDAQRHPAVPRLTAQQTEAIELIGRFANDKSVHLEMDFRPGDIQWLANDRILHSREAYEGHPGQGQPAIANRRELT